MEFCVSRQLLQDPVRQFCQVAIEFNGHSVDWEENILTTKISWTIANSWYIVHPERMVKQLETKSVFSPGFLASKVRLHLHRFSSLLTVSTWCPWTSSQDNCGKHSEHRNPIIKCKKSLASCFFIIFWYILYHLCHISSCTTPTPPINLIFPNLVQLSSTKHLHPLRGSSNLLGKSHRRSHHSMPDRLLLEERTSNNWGFEKRQTTQYSSELSRSLKESKMIFDSHDFQANMIQSCISILINITCIYTRT